MGELKYGKYFLTEPRLRNHTAHGKIVAPKAVLQSGIHFNVGNFSICWECVTQPMVMDPVPHTHDFDEYLAFMGSNAEDVFDFDAEVEVYMGEEGEKHVIDKATVLYIPAGLVHCPVVYKRIGKPILFDVIAFSPHYWDVPDQKSFFVREGGKDKAIADLNQIIKDNFNPSTAETARKYLKEIDKDK